MHFGLGWKSQIHALFDGKLSLKSSIFNDRIFIFKKSSLSIFGTWEIVSKSIIHSQ